MKKIQSSLKATVCMAAVALAAIGCSQDEWAEQSAPKGNTTIVASFDGADTRTSVNSDNNVVWNQNDAFGLFYTTQTSTTPSATEFSCPSADGTSTTAAFSGTLDDGATTSYAVYPYQESMSLSNNTVTMKLPASFDYTTASNGPMYTPASDITKSISFKHLAGLLKLTVSSNIATEAKRFVITADKNIAGTCTADLSATAPELVVTSGDDASTTITVNLSFNAEQTAPTTFYIPIPTGTYSTLKAELQDNSGKALFPAKEWSNITVARASMLTSSFGFITIDATTPSKITEAIAAALPTEAPAEPVTTNVELSGAISNETSGSSSAIELPIVKNSNVNLSLATLPSTSSAIELKDKSTTETDPTTAVNTVSIAIPKVESGNTAPSFTITMPKTTVVLDANSTDGTTTYGTVTAKTALNTLVVNKGVTVTKLIAAGGNIRVAGTITELAKATDFSDDVLVIVEPGASATIPETGFTKIDATVYDMKNALANGENYVLTADADITGQYITVPADKTATLDLSGHTITGANSSSDNDRFNVYGELTLKDSSNGGSGKIIVNKDYAKAQYDGGIFQIIGENAHMTMESGTINTVRTTPGSNGQYAIVLSSDGDFTMTGGKIEAGWYAVSGNGDYATQNSIINITGGELSSATDYAIYLPQSGTTNISGGTIKGAAGGICMQRGTLNISGTASISSNGTGDTGNWSDGTGKTGNATLAIAGKYGECTVNISGGTLTATGTAQLLIKEGGNHPRHISITGGNFSDPSVLDYLSDNANVNIAQNKDCETTALYIPQNQTVTMNLNKHKLTIKADQTPANINTEIGSKPNKNVLISGNLTLKNGSVENDKEGMSLIAANAKMELNNITYTTTSTVHYGIYNNSNIEGSSITIKNSTMTSKYYAISTNALVNPVGRTTITLENSTFTADETALMVNIPSTITAGGWQGVFLRGGTATFTDSHINLKFVDSYATSSKAQGATWGSGNDAPAAALTAGNRSSGAYDYKTKITLTNTAFSNSGTDKSSKAATEQPAIYIDTETASSKPNQGVELTYDEASKTSFSAAGKGLVIGQKANVKINGSTPE